MDDPRGGARTRTSPIAALFSVLSLVASAPAAAAGIVSHTGSGDPTASTASTAQTAPVTSVFDDAYAWDPQFYGPGLDGTVTSAVVWDDGDGADLYVGGSFITAGSQRVDRIARWDGTSWSALPGESGVGVNGAVSALAVFDGDLVVGGSFTRAGGETVNRIARWDGAQWSPLDGPAGTGVAGGVSAVTFGIESLTAAAPITVNIYTLDGEFVFDNLTLIGTETTTLSFQTLSTVTIPVTGTAPAGSTLAVELEAPDMQGAFYPGANTAGPTAPSYVAAPGCGEPEPIPFAEIAGEPVHLVLTVTGGERPECTLPEWLDVAPAHGTTAPGASSELGVSIDTAGLAPGPYAAHLCIESNDPDTVLSAVPIKLTVIEGPDLTLSVKADRVRPFYYRSQLSWTGGSTEQIDVYRDGELVTTTANDGAFTDEIGRIPEAVAMQYRVCEAAAVTCSDTVTVEIDPRPSRPMVTTGELPALNLVGRGRHAHVCTDAGHHAALLRVQLLGSVRHGARHGRDLGQ